ncbi:MAG: heme o synthase [Alphaproteobacteria bacterium]
MQQGVVVTSVGAEFIQLARSYLSLLKPRVMSLVVFSGAAGMALAPEKASISVWLMAMFCLALGTGAAAALNMWYDRDIDTIMRRTRDRPIPAGDISAEAVLAFGVVLAIASVAFMGLGVNWVAAFWLAMAIIWYVGVYTVWLKRRSVQNIVIGGAAGAFPPVIGWAAASGHVAGDLFVWQPWLLFLIVFLWTPPHFWALALYRHDDYKQAKVPMLPVVAGALSTKKHILAYSILLLPVSLTPYAAGLCGGLYLAVASLMGLIFVAASYRLLTAKDEQKAQKTSMAVFGYSILYLFMLLAIMIIDVV